MLNQQTIEQLRTLKLTGMLDALEQQWEQPQTHALSFDERLALLLEREVLLRENRRHACSKPPSCDWIRQSHNLCITGPTGCGKTWLACALGNQACRQGLSVRYLRLPTLFEQLRIAHGDGSYPRLMNQLLKMDLLILGHPEGNRCPTARPDGGYRGPTRQAINSDRQSTAHGTLA